MNFEEMTLADLAAPQKNAIVGGPFGSNLGSKDYVETGVPVIRGTNMGEKWVGGDFVFVSPEKALLLSQNLARPKDLVFTQRGTLGQVAIVPDHEHDRYVVSQSQMKITVDSTKADIHFLYYLFSSPDQLQYIRNSAIQTGVPHTNLGILKKTPVRIPALAVQKKIAAILTVLDERITSLTETNATLESIAQTLFKSWFIDFDPVRAKLEGREPEGMDAKTAALFSIDFEECESILLPKGWQLGKVKDLMCLSYGKALKATNRIPGDVPVYGSGGITGTHNEALVNGTSIIIGRKGTVGSLYWEDKPFFPIDTVFYVTTDLPLTYCFYLLQTLGLEQMNTDGAVPGLNRDNVYRLPVAIAPEKLLVAFDQIVLPIRKSICSNLDQIRTLSAIRDTLLPRLISGQLRLLESEPQLQDAA